MQTAQKRRKKHSKNRKAYLISTKLPKLPPLPWGKTEKGGKYYFFPIISVTSVFIISTAVSKLLQVIRRVLQKIIILLTSFYTSGEHLTLTISLYDTIPPSCVLILYWSVLTRQYIQIPSMSWEIRQPLILDRILPNLLCTWTNPCLDFSQHPECLKLPNAIGPLRWIFL